MYLKDDSLETQQMRENILRLISSSEESNFTLAIQLMKGGGFVLETTTLIWAKALTLNAKKRAPLLTLLKKNLPTRLYKIIEISWKYPNNFYVYAIRYFDELASYVYIGWERLLQDILPHAFQYGQKHQHKLNAYLINNPQTPKEMLLSMWSQDNMLSFYDLPVETFPDVLDKLPHITYINIQGTRIKEIPESFFSLPNLNHFYFNGTPLENDKHFWQQLKERMPFVWGNIMIEKYKSFDYKDRLPYCQQALEDLPERVDILADTLLSFTYQHTPTKYQQALEVYIQHKSEESEQDIEILHTVGDIYYEMQDFENALLYYQKWVHLEKTEPEAWYSLAKVCASLEKYQEAIYANNQAIALYPYNIVYYQQLAKAYWQSGDWKNTLNICQAGLQNADHRDLYLLHQAYLICQAQGDEIQAESYRKQIFGNFYGSVGEQIFVGKFYESFGDFKGAIKIYKYILDNRYVSELICEVRTLLGKLYLKQGKYYSAEVLFFDNIEYLPEDAQNWLDLACAIAMQEDYELAEEYLAKALHLQPSLSIIEQYEYLKNLPSLQ